MQTKLNIHTIVDSTVYRVLYSVVADAARYVAHRAVFKGVIIGTDDIVYHAVDRTAYNPEVLELVKSLL